MGKEVGEDLGGVRRGERIDQNMLYENLNKNKHE